MTGDRYRMVTVQNGTEHVSSVVLNYDEAGAQLLFERTMHNAAGWRVAQVRGEGLPHLVFTKGAVTRAVFAKRFSAMDDPVAAQVDSPPVPAPPPTHERT